MGPYNVIGDAELDPGSSRFPGGVVDAAVGHIPSNGPDSRYFLFTGNTTGPCQYSGSCMIHVVTIRPPIQPKKYDLKLNMLKEILKWRDQYISKT